MFWANTEYPRLVKHFIMPSYPPPSFRQAPQDTQAASGLHFLAANITDLAVDRIGHLSRLLVIFQQPNSMIKEVPPITTFFKCQRMFATAAYFDQYVVFIKKSGKFHNLSMFLYIFTHTDVFDGFVTGS